MSLECAHCGARCEDGASRCPKCLRTTHLVPVPLAAAKPSGSRRASGVVGVLLGASMIAVGVWRVSQRPPPAPVAEIPVAMHSLESGPALAPLVQRARQTPDGTARARLVVEAIQSRRTASVVAEGDAIPAPRSPDRLWSVLAMESERVTELDLARLAVAVLREAGDRDAAVVERTGARRSDEPTDPTGAVGGFMATRGSDVLDVSRGSLVPSGQIAHVALTDATLSGAIAAQAACEAAESGVRDRALEYANEAVRAWPGSPTPLMARAHVWRLVGASSGSALADQDLQTAIALREDASQHLSRARLMVADNRFADAAYSARRANTLAPAWGPAALAVLALSNVARAVDAGATDGCASLRNARSSWTDDAFALCAESTPAGVRAQSADRLLHSASDPLRIAYAAAHGAQNFLSRARASERREAAAWLSLFGHPELARPWIDPGDGGL